jgi:hypothetical protein
MSLAQPACEDQPEIWKGSIRLRRVCFKSVGLSVGECWCMHAVPPAEGSSVWTHIPCDQARSATDFDRKGMPESKPSAPNGQGPTENYCEG